MYLTRFGFLFFLCPKAEEKSMNLPACLVLEILNYSLSLFRLIHNLGMS